VVCRQCSCMEDDGRGQEWKEEELEEGVCMCQGGMNEGRGCTMRRDVVGARCLCEIKVGKEWLRGKRKVR